jgi:hypothetical protein
MATVTTEEPTPPEPSSLRKWHLLWAPRLILVVAALVSLWFAQHRFEAWQQQYSATFSFDFGQWYEWVGLTALSGLAFGLAAWLPEDRFSYRWTRVFLLGVAPVALLGVISLFFEFLDRGSKLPGLLNYEYFYFAIGPQFALAIVLGVAVSSGFEPVESPPGL